MQYTHNIKQFSVSELSRNIKQVMEDRFGYVRICGEISGFKEASSGHLYFNLKDNIALINAICFKNMASLIPFKLKDGMEVVVSGRVTTYEARSNYQIIVEKVEIAGIGDIMAEIEARKLKLLKEGYFDESLKKTLPFLPKTIGVITSPTGAVIEDIIHRISDRFPCNLQIYPASMQGKNSALEVIAGLKYFNNISKDNQPNLIIIARGGGSFEDLLPFNDEDLVKEVSKCNIPVISAIGHETDTTLIDLASDKRAPTPSAAAEMAVPVLKDIKSLLNNLSLRINNYFNNFISLKHNSLTQLGKNLIHPNKALEILSNKSIDLFLSLKSNVKFLLSSKDNNLNTLSTLLAKPNHSSNNLQDRLNFLRQNLQNNYQNNLITLENKIYRAKDLLESYNYKNVLKRGYGVVRDSNNKILSNAKNTKNNQQINIEMSDGNFDAMVVNKLSPTKKGGKKATQQQSLF